MTAAPVKIYEKEYLMSKQSRIKWRTTAVRIDINSIPRLNAIRSSERKEAMK